MAGTPARAKRPKYSNKKIVLDGETFDSKAECRRYQELLILRRTGQISDLKRQVAFELVPSVKLLGAARATPAIRYFADFTYIENGALVVEDTKGYLTTEYKMKRHMMKAVHGIDIRETA